MQKYIPPHRRKAEGNSNIEIKDFATLMLGNASTTESS